MTGKTEEMHEIYGRLSDKNKDIILLLAKGIKAAVKYSEKMEGVNNKI